MFVIFAIILCYLSNNELKDWKFQAWTGLEPELAAAQFNCEDH